MNVEAAFERMEAHPRWRRLGWLYLWIVLFHVVTSVGSISMSEIGCLPLALAGLVSLNVVWPTLRVLLRERVLWAVAAFAAWMAISLLWSSDVGKGGWEIGWGRFAWLPLAIYPVMRRRRLLIAALAAGFLLTNVSQVVHWLGHALDVPALMFRPWTPRNSGWWSHPAVFGYMFVGALGLHLPAAMMGRGRQRLIAVLGAGATVAGMVATGTRGAWLGGAVLVALVGVVSVVVWVRRKRGGQESRPQRRLDAGMAGVPVVAVIVGVVILAAQQGVRERVGSGITEIRQAMSAQRYESDTGARIKFAAWAVRMGMDRPIWGHGAGSYETWARADLRAGGVNPDTVRTAPQAHNLWLHAFATLGIVGVGLLVAIVLCAVRGGFAGLTLESVGTYDAGPAFALLGVLLTTPFDVQYVNTPPVILLAVLISLCMRRRPLAACVPSLVPGRGV